MRKAIFVVALGAAALFAQSASAGELNCNLRFNLKSWSVFYKHSEGNGIVRCSDGTTLPVKIEAKGGGLTVGKSTVRDGQGRFSSVYNIRDVLGGYATAEANAAAGDNAMAQVVTKGPISLALSGKGKGVALGVSFGSFIISEAGAEKH
ncbi:hypothetical protein [Solilutibacter silvestris]|uniref:Secreted protein n=1 Tax=Solilutibacter silvestris TaxID=1645665 RepID=A0A2K1Q1S8_9GAMM|nr:hypothetical protein [Lysobacter silvestris]PNS08984.1 hypothetical protein Lysil_0613 [Lysobacter silvestris]